MRALLLIFLAIALSTCTKFGRTITVKGRVLNPITGEGVEGIKIQLVRSQSFKLPGGYKEVKSTTSDANGNFEINKSGFNHYSIQAQFVDYPIGWFVDGEFKGDFRMPVKVGKKITADYHTVPYGKLQINFKNISCMGANDKIELFYDGAQIDSKEFNIGKITELNGCIDISGELIKITNGKKFFHWTVTKNSITTNFTDTIEIYENQTTVLQIDY